MKNWKYISGAEVGNEGLSLCEKLKTAGKDHIVMKSADGGEVQIKKDGEAWYKKDNQSQMVRDKHSSFEKAVEAYKLHGFKLGNALKYSNYSDAMAMWKQRDWSKTLAEKENGHSSPVREQMAIYKKDDTFYVMERQEASSKGMSDLEVFPIKRIKNSKTGNAFDFETQAVVDRKEAVKTAEEELRKAEAERNKHRGERYWEEAYITAKKDVERAKENLARAQRNKAGNSDGVARMFEGLVKDENKETEKDSGAIEDLEKVGNIQFAGDYYDIVVIKKNGNILYKGMQDYANDDNIPWKYNEAKGIYEGPDGLTKEKIG